MSFIAKFYLTKMFRKDKALSIDGDDLKITWQNVIAPIKNKDVPDEIWKYFELIGDDNKVLLNASTKDAWKKTKGMWGTKTYTLNNYKTLQGTVIPIGDDIMIWVTNPGWKKGEIHKLTVRIIQDRPIEFSIQLPVN